MKLDPSLRKRYRILRPLGRGGQADVALAQDLVHGGHVALKFVKMGSDPRRARRFVREARVMAGLDHPHLVRLLDAVAEHRPPFLVLEHLRGPSLEEALEARRRFPAEEVRALGSALASGLAELHARGVIHRDVKPANVLVVPQRGPVLVDLGLAYELGGEDLTRTGAVLGTPAYLPPEVYGLTRAGPEADVFGLVTLLHELVVGERPFSARDLVRAGDGSGLPAGPADTLTDLLGPVAARGLAPDPATRPTAHELAEALRDPDARKTLEGIEARILAGSEARPPRRSTSVSRALASEELASRSGERRLSRELGRRRSGRHAAVPPLPRAQAAPGTALAVLALGFGLASFFGRRVDRLPPPPPPTLGGSPPARVGASKHPAEPAPELAPAPTLPAGPAMALGLRVTPHGLALQVDGASPPDRVRFLHGEERWTVPPTPVPGGASYPLGRTLDGHRPLQAEPLRKTSSGTYRSMGSPEWWRMDMLPTATRLEPTPAELSTGPFLPRPAGTRESAPPAVAWEPAPAAVLVRTAVPLHPGLVLARLGGARLAWGVVTDGDGTWLKGVAPDASGRGEVWPIPPGHVAAGGAGLVALDDALGLMTRAGREKTAPWSWQVLRRDAPGAPVDLAELGFEPTLGPLPRPGGGAAWVDARGRLLLADASGDLRLPSEEAGEPFLRRAGTLKQAGRHAVLSGVLGEAPGLLLLDLEAGEVELRVRGVPALGPGHPVVVGPPGAEAVVGLAGDQRFQIPLTALLAAAAKGPEARWSDLPVARAARAGALPEPRAEALAWPRAEAAGAGTHGGLLRLALAAPPEGGTPPSLVRADFLRWALEPAELAIPARPLDVGPFPVLGPARHQGMLAVGSDGTVVTLVETAADRWVLEVGRLDAPGPSHVRWTLPAHAGLRSPTLVPGAVLIETWRSVLRYPVPWLSTVAP